MSDLTVRLPETAAARGRVAPRHFAHIVYKTPRFEEMIAWYATVLEAEPVLKNELLVLHDLRRGASPDRVRTSRI